MIFRTFDRMTRDLPLANEIQVGPHPDMVTFSSDCRTIIVCNEGEPGKNETGGFEDPEGSVTILKFSTSDLTTAPLKQTVDFTKFNERALEYKRRGVRWIYEGIPEDRTTFSQDLEPEYVTLSKDETKAYVVLQENNAVAVVDVIRADAIELYPLGFKDWGRYRFDASDRDKRIDQNFWVDIMGMYQPDAIKLFDVNGVSYIIGACEGDSKDYRNKTHGRQWTEERRGFYLRRRLSRTMNEASKLAVQDNLKLGRLKFSAVDGLDYENNFTKLYSYGARSIAIWRADDFSLVYESGSELEDLYRDRMPIIFNSFMGNTSLTPSTSMDLRSDDKGPEPESLDIAQIGDTTLIALGNERTSSVVLYAIRGNSVTPTFQALFRNGDIDATWEELYQQRRIGDIDPEDIRIIHPRDSPTGEAMLLVSGSLSGTVTLYRIVGLNVNQTGTGLPTDFSPQTNIPPIVTARPDVSVPGVAPVTISMQTEQFLTTQPWPQFTTPHAYDGHTHGPGDMTPHDPFQPDPKDHTHTPTGGYVGGGTHPHGTVVIDHTHAPGGTHDHNHTHGSGTTHDHTHGPGGTIHHTHGPNHTHGLGGSHNHTHDHHNGSMSTSALTISLLLLMVGLSTFLNQ
nr:shell protein 1 [Terebratalia transversa]